MKAWVSCLTYYQLHSLAIKQANQAYYLYLNNQNICCKLKKSIPCSPQPFALHKSPEQHLEHVFVPAWAVVRSPGVVLVQSFKYMEFRVHENVTIYIITPFEIVFTIVMTYEN